jgi:hypothetical protein
MMVTLCLLLGMVQIHALEILVSASRNKFNTQWRKRIIDYCVHFLLKPMFINTIFYLFV